MHNIQAPLTKAFKRAPPLNIRRKESVFPDGETVISVSKGKGEHPSQQHKRCPLR